MGVNMLTALIIQSRGKDIVCQAGGPTKEGKYVGWITLFDNGEYDHELLSTEPIYDTEKEAIAAMKDVVKEIRKLDLKPPEVVKEAIKDTAEIRELARK